MDQIEPAGDSPDPPEGQLQPHSEILTTSYSRQRAHSLRSRPSIRIQRPPSVERANWQAQQNIDTNSQGNPRNIGIDAVQNNEDDDDDSRQSRRRSNSEPRPGQWSASSSPVVPLRLETAGNTNHRMSMYPLKEEPTSPSPSFQNFSTQLLPEDITAPPPVNPRRGGRLRRASDAALHPALHRFSRNRASTLSGPPSASARAVVSTTYDNAGEYHPQIVDVLDVIDPEVSALSTLTNVQNSLFVPNLGTWLNRQPTYTLSPPGDLQGEESTSTDEGEESASDIELKQTDAQPTVERFTSLSAVLEEGPDRRFAVLPEESDLEGWTKRDIEELNDRVRHMLHSRRSKFRRAMVGFRRYISKPLGFLVTLYATLITLFGLAWVLFLIGWINVGGRQLYMIDVIDNVLVALFAVMGDGLAPFRAIDTYHMIFIAHYTFLTWKIRRKRALPDLKDKNDLPARQETDIEMETGDPSKGEDYDENEEHEFSVLSSAQQQKLSHHQEKLSKSHTFYKPHETLTHHAFPLRMLIAIIVLLDCHSLFQIALGACTWGISYHVRPFALTTVILCCSITCNIAGGVLIMIGDRRTRKTDVVELLFRQQLTGEAMKKMRKKKKKEEIRKSMEQQKALEASPATPTSPQKPRPYDGT